MKNLSLVENLEKDQIRLKLKAFVDEYTQIYNANKKDEIEKIIDNLNS